MTATNSPREDPIKIVDASNGDWYDRGRFMGALFGIVTAADEDTGAPRVPNEAVGGFDPYSLRYHDLGEDRQGIRDRRLSIQVCNDYDGDDGEGEAPFGQPEFYSPKNRSTREADAAGRVAIPSTHRRVIDAEDGRYALALTVAGPPLTTPELVLPGDPEPSAQVAGQAYPDGVQFFDAGSSGGVTSTAPRVSIGGVTFLGQGASDAARTVLAAGGTPGEAAQAASAAATGRPVPSGLPGYGETQERGGAPAPPPPEELNPEGNYTPGRPAGYVWSRDSRRIGLLGTVVDPAGADGFYVRGSEGTPIGPLPIRHDAHFSMGPAMTGRIRFEPRVATSVPRGKTLFRGEMQAAPELANNMTEVGLETTQWVPVVGVDMRIGPSRVVEREKIIIQEKEKKPETPPPGGGGKPPRPPTGEDEDDTGERDPQGDPPPEEPPPVPPVSVGAGRVSPNGGTPGEPGRPPTGGGGGGKPETGGGGPPAGGGGGGGAGEPGSGTGATCGAGPGDKGPRGGGQGGGAGAGGTGGAGGGAAGGGGKFVFNPGGMLPEVAAPTSQVRDYESPGVPCPNSTAGVENAECGKTTQQHVGGMVEDEGGRMIDTHGHPAVTTGTVLVGGVPHVVTVLGGSQPPRGGAFGGGERLGGPL